MVELALLILCQILVARVALLGVRLVLVAHEVLLVQLALVFEEELLLLIRLLKSLLNELLGFLHLLSMRLEVVDLCLLLICQPHPIRIKVFVIDRVDILVVVVLDDVVQLEGALRHLLLPRTGLFRQLLVEADVLHSA